MTFPTILARALAPAAAVAALAAPAPAATTGELALVEQHLAASPSMTANFVQIDSKSRQLVGNGKTLTFIDYDVGQKSSWAIGKSPLSVLLSGNPDLGRIARVLPSDDPRVLLVRARDGRRPEFGTMILAFVKSPGAPAGLRLEGWTAIDAQNKRTTVKLDGQRYNVAVPESAFSYPEPKKRGKG